ARDGTALRDLSRRELARSRGSGRRESGAEPFREERGHDAGENVAAAGGRKRGSAEGADPDARAGLSDQRVGTLQQADAAELLRSPPRGFDPMRCDPARRLAEQARELALVRREDRRCRALERLEL